MSERRATSPTSICRRGVSVNARFACCAAVALLLAPRASAFDLDQLLPLDISGYGMPFSVIDINRLRRADDATGVRLGDLMLNPSLDLSAGFDSAPNGVAHGSASFNEMPSLMVSDQQIGLGALLAGTATQFPQTGRQDVSGATVAIGERAVLPSQTVTVSGAYIKAQETGFALTTIALSRPLAFSLGDLRASDAIIAGLFGLEPEVAVTRYDFDDLPSLNRTNARERFTTTYAPGGPGRLVLLLQANQSTVATGTLNAETEAALAGVSDDQTGLLNLRLLAGVAHRQSPLGDLTTPVLEAAVDWIPGDLDRLRLKVSREVDDPDQISTTPYTLSEAGLSLTHEYLRNVDLDASARVARAEYNRSPLRETLFSTEDGISWQLNAALALKADYTFNDRQANYLRAANEHVITMGVSWTP